MLAAWLRWFGRLAYEGERRRIVSWQRNRMEYAFALARPATSRSRADEYTDGHVDWDDFRVSALGDQRRAGPSATFAVASRHPSPVRYPGMPAERYWEFEDGNVNFAGAEAGVTDLLRMCVTEFALTFGNDWFVVPVRLPVGWLYQVACFDITDSFGIAGKSAADRESERHASGRCTSSPLTARPRARSQHTLFLPDSVDGVQEGAVLEETLLARDEMANLAWAIEQHVQGVSGEPLDRDLEAKGLAFQQQIHFDSAPTARSWSIGWRHRCRRTGRRCCRCAIPRLNLTDPLDDPPRARRHEALLSGRQRRGHRPRRRPGIQGRSWTLLDAQTTSSTRRDRSAPSLRAYVFYPRGWLLRARSARSRWRTTTRLFIEEEEVPRIGARLKRKFQYARSSDGRSWLWIGRSKIAGRGEAASELRFDVAVKTTTVR